MLTDFYSKAILDLLFAKSDDFIGIFDLDEKRYVRINPAGVKMLGYSTELEFLLDPVRSRTLRAQSLTAQLEIIEKLIDVGYYEETSQIEKKDGQTFWGRLTVNAFTLQNRSFGLIRLINQERLHQAELELEHSILRNQAIFYNATIGILVCDEHGQIVSSNQLADKMLGYTPGELQQLSVEQLVPHEVGQYHAKYRQSFNKNPQVRAMGHSRDLSAKRKDGSIFPVEISLSYFRINGRINTIAYIIDTTLKKEAERQLMAHRDHIERLNANLEKTVSDRTQALLATLEQLEKSKNDLAKALIAERELSELKSRFVSMASHEFRTPLTTIQSASSLIESYSASNQQDKLLKNLHRIQSAVKQLNDILEEFLSVGKLEEGKIQAKAVEVNVGQLIQETVADMQGILKTGQTVQTQVAISTPIWLDGSLLRKIIVNLLSNAIKYSGSNSPVYIKAESTDGRLRLEVRDQGIGIPVSDQQHLFDRFYRAKNVMNISGTGLGLHIVAKYAELMQGTVQLTSELNSGTTFTITLPYENHSVD